MINLLKDDDKKLALVDNGDGTVSFGFAAGAEAVKQLVCSRLHFRLGEGVWNDGVGLPWDDILVISSSNEERPIYEQEIRTAILDTTGVEDIVELKFVWDYTKRKLSLSGCVIIECDSVRETVNINEVL